MDGNVTLSDSRSTTSVHTQLLDRLLQNLAPTIIVQFVQHFQVNTSLALTLVDILNM